MARFNYIAPIQWHEGMMLVPQHFQQNDLRFEQAISYCLGQMFPFMWGVNIFKFDPISFPDGIIKVLELEGIMPDGTIISYNSKLNGDLGPLEIDLNEFKNDFQTSDKYLYAVLPEVIDGISPLEGDKPRYYAQKSDNVIDFNSHENQIMVPKLYPRLSLYLGSIPPEQHAALPLMKLSYRDDNFVERSYQPPFFKVTKTDLIGELTNGLARRIREKAIFLSEKWQNEIDQTMSAETRSTLVALLQSIPSLEAKLNSQVTHPYDLYLEFCRVLGNLSTMSLGAIGPSLPVYNHNDILLSYTHLFDRMKRILDGVEQSYAVVLFDKRDRLFSTQLANYEIKDHLYIGVKMGPGMEQSNLHEWMKDCIIASDSAVKAVRDKRITGATRDYVQNLHAIGLIPAKNTYVFKVGIDHKHIFPNETLHIFNPADNPELRPSSITLYVIDSLKGAS